MKSYRPFGFCMVFLFGSLVFAQPNPVAHWTFDDADLTNVSGN